LNPKLYWLSKSFPGKLAISARPRGGDWLDLEVEGWRKQGVDIVVSLLIDAENEEFGLQKEAVTAEQSGIRFYSFPIEDRGVPSSKNGLDRLVAQLGSLIRQGKNLAIHCRQGIGRSSLVAAAVLLAAGDDLNDSLQEIRDVRGLEVPETSQQREWLMQFAKAHALDVARQNH
jgi:protein-tyrosine phosphatase